jgi:DeoR family fructose operon transcriptional repressor
MIARTNGAEQAGMFMEERQRAILDLLARQGKVTVEDLAAAFRVSAPTIRTDLARLEEQGLLQRTHGGAIPASPTLYEPPYAQRQVIRHAEKRAIAQAAAELVANGETILLDAGTTTYELALLLKERQRLTVVTNSLANAQTLSENPGIEVIVTGGTLQARRRALLGPLAARFLESFHVDRAFLAFNGVHHQAGFTVTDFDAAELKRRMVGAATQVVAVADSGKIGQIAFAKAAELREADMLVTDSGAAPESLNAIREAGLKVVVAGRGVF